MITDPIEVCEEIDGCAFENRSTPEEAIQSITEAISSSRKILSRFSRLEIRLETDGDDAYAVLCGYRLETPEETQRRVAASRAEFERLGREFRT